MNPTIHGYHLLFSYFPTALKRVYGEETLRTVPGSEQERRARCKGKANQDAEVAAARKLACIVWVDSYVQAALCRGE
jgi:hypothetical protein